MATPAPVSARDRIETLDVLRGFALFGILAMNIRAMAAPFGAYMFPYALRRLWFRRMFCLLAIGLIHAYLIWDGDILVPYALCGILLLWWVRRRSARWLAIAAVAMLLIGVSLNIGHGLGWDSMAEADRAEEAKVFMPTPEQAQEQLATMLGSYSGVVAHRASFVLMGQTMFFALFFFWRCGGMMLLGMALYKSGFLDGRRALGTYATVAALAIPGGLALAWWGVVEMERVRYAMPTRAYLDVWNYVGAVFASIGYAAALILIVKRQALPALRRALAAVGQMALSNYLFHSILSSIVFLGWGFGFAGRLDYAEQLLFVAAVWLVQLIVSPLWLARFRFGPAEWLWRSLTYGQRQPFRRS